MLHKSDPLQMEKYKKIWILISIIILFAGIDVAILISKWSRLFGVTLAIIGGIMLYVKGK